MRFLDWEEYKFTDDPYPRGEICIKTDIMVTRYYKVLFYLFIYLSGIYVSI